MFATVSAACAVAFAMASGAPPSEAAPEIQTPAASIAARVIRSACDAITPDVEVRVAGEFGFFHGRIRSATPEGLDGLVPRFAAGSTMAIPKHLDWDQIYSVETLGNSSAKGARTAGLVLGGVGLILGLVAGLASSDSGTSDHILGPVALGTVGGLTFGAAIGAIVGAGIPRWEKVYERQ